MPIRQVRARALRVPITEPYRTAGGTIFESPLLLTDVIAEDGLTDHSAIFTYTAAALKPIVQLIENVQPVTSGMPLDPAQVYDLLHARFRLLGCQGFVGMAIDVTLITLAHTTSRAILERVMRQEMRVTELAEPSAISLNAVSKHIQVLERALLVQRHRVWREHLVSFNPGPLDEVTLWIEQRRKFWNTRLGALDAMLKAQDAAARRMREI